MSNPNPAPLEEAPWLAGWESVRALFRPGLVLQLSAIGVVIAYYHVPAAGGVVATLADWRNKGGYLFSAVSNALCGGVLPFLFFRISPATRPSYPWPHLLFFAAFWAWKGVEIDFMYRTLAQLFGHDHGVGTVAKKVLADQFGYNPLYAAPIGNLCFAWKDARFRWAPVAADLHAGRWYYRRVFPVLLTVWALWIPVVCCVYSLPEPLQVPLFSIVLCFWSLLFAHITAKQNRAPDRASP